MLISHPLNLPKLVCSAMEIGANHILNLNREAQPKLEGLEGKVLAVHMVGLDVTIYLRVINRSVCVFDRYSGEADVSISGLPSALLKLAVQDDIMSLMLSGEIKMEGDVKLGQKLKFIFSHASMDWEELLFNLLGDLPASQLRKAFKKVSTDLKRVRQSLGDNVSEYLQEEARSLPNKLEVKNFVRDVDVLRDDAERLICRLQRIKGTMGKL